MRSTSRFDGVAQSTKHPHYLLLSWPLKRQHLPGLVLPHSIHVLVSARNDGNDVTAAFVCSIAGLN